MQDTDLNTDGPGLQETFLLSVCGLKVGLLSLSSPKSTNLMDARGNAVLPLLYLDTAYALRVTSQNTRSSNIRGS